MDVQRQGPPAPSRLDGRVVAGAVLVLLVLVVASLAARGADWTAPAATAPSTQTAPARPPAVGSTAATPPATRPPQRENSPLPPFRPPTWVLVGVLAVLAAAVLAGTVRYAPRPRWRRRRPVRPERPVAAEPEAPEAPDRRPLAEAADRALADMDQPDAREAVIRSWLLFGEAAGESGLPLRPAETAAEYAARLATEFYVPVPMLTRLAELYREARFSKHEVSGPQRAEARDLLERLSGDLEHGRR